MDDVTRRKKRREGGEKRKEERTPVASWFPKTEGGRQDTNSACHTKEAQQQHRKYGRLLGTFKRLMPSQFPYPQDRLFVFICIG